MKKYVEQMVMYQKGSDDMTRNEYDIEECLDRETGEFDWDRYQYLCDIAEYWGCEE